MLLKKKFVLFLSLVLILSLASACTQQGSSKKANKELAVKQSKVSFGYVNWPGVTVKTEVAKEVLESLGYEVETSSLGEQVIFKSMENDELDAFLGNWMPSMKNTFEPYQKKGVIENVRLNLDQALYKTAVPKYVWEAGVKSMADLNKYADKFDHQIIGLEAGNAGNIIIKNAIDNNTYQLKDWELMSGSTAAMLATVERATKKKEWVAFHGWKPHWMNIKYDLKYLEDPEGIWGEESEVYTAARPELKKEAPNFYKFLEQFNVSSEIQSGWILEYQKKGRPAEEVAQEWIKNNNDLIQEWVVGMTTVDGKDAVETIKNKLN
ncbi:ABC transporter substrate-binding protein [Orenia marismortui]|uniref:ABC transporter substrate-binding protein n=1 Tax=Orenia marismortui TaxID=46469 RepID=UPI0003825A9E|nr:ABC transporter substrate-binding protein [Orenia marismortui]